MFSDALAYLAANLPKDYPLPTLSYSSLKEMETCSWRWNRRYLQGLTTPLTEAMVLGSGIHAGMEAFHKDEDAQRAAESYIRDRWVFAGGDRLSKALTTSQRIVRAACEKYPQQADATEIRTEALVGGVRLVAITDCLQDKTVVDYKSTGREWAPDPLQLAVNALTLTVNGYEVTRGELRQLRKDVTGDRVSITHEHPYELTEAFVLEQAQEIVRRVENLVARIQIDLWAGPQVDDPGRFCGFQCSVPSCPVAALTQPRTASSHS